MHTDGLDGAATNLLMVGRHIDTGQEGYIRLSHTNTVNLSEIIVRRITPPLLAVGRTVCEQNLHRVRLAANGNGERGKQFALAAAILRIKLNLYLVIGKREGLVERRIVGYQCTCAAHAPLDGFGVQGILLDGKVCCTTVLAACELFQDQPVGRITAGIGLTPVFTESEIIRNGRNGDRSAIFYIIALELKYKTLCLSCYHRQQYGQNHE